MLFIYDRAQFQEVRPLLREASRAGMVCLGVSAEHFRSDLRTLSNHDLVVVPTSLERCTPVVERMKSIANIAGIRCENLCSYLSARNRKANTPVAANAVPPSQHLAAAGKS